MSLFEATPLTRADLAERQRPQAQHLMESYGSREIEFFVYRDCTVISSIDPSGENGGLEIHVSVSQNGRPCELELASRIGKAIHPHVTAWDAIGAKKEAIHLWVACDVKEKP